jgi:hypothetical protein
MEIKAFWLLGKVSGLVTIVLCSAKIVAIGKQETVFSGTALHRTLLAFNQT